MKIGFIGLGNMGRPMATTLVKAGHEVTAFNLIAGPPDGAVKADTASQAARHAQVVITMLPNGAILRAVAAEIMPVLTPGTVFADFSNVDVDCAKAVARMAEDAGCLAQPMAL